MRSKSRANSLDDFDVITGPPAPPLAQAKSAEPAMPNGAPLPGAAPVPRDIARPDPQ